MAKATVKPAITTVKAKKAPAKRLYAVENKARRVPADALNAMIAEVKEKLAIRDEFEAAKGKPTSNWLTISALAHNNIEPLARLCIAMNAKPSAFLTDSRLSGTMPNMYGLVKIIEIANYVLGAKNSLQNVTTAFLLCAIHYAKNVNTYISNKNTEMFLTNAKEAFAKIEDPETRETLMKLQRKANFERSMATQASQCRCAIEALGLGRIDHRDRKRGGVVINTNASLFNALVRDFYNEENE